jgi:hypothetical protein
VEQSESAETQTDDNQQEDVAPASSYATVLKGIVDRVYADGDKDFGFIVHGEDQYYFDPRLLASEERPERGDRVFFTPKPPLKRDAKPAAGCVLVKEKPAIGTVVNILPNGESCFLQVTDNRDNRYNVWMAVSKERIGEVQKGDQFRFMAGENPSGVCAAKPVRLGY